MVIATLPKLLSVFKRVGGKASTHEKRSFRQPGQGRLWGSIGYLLSNLEAATMNILVHKKAIVGWISSGYCTSFFRDKGLLNIYNFLPVNLSTKRWIDEDNEPVCVCVCQLIVISVPVSAVNTCLCMSSKNRQGSSALWDHKNIVFLFSVMEMPSEIEGRASPSPRPLLSYQNPEIIKK